MQMTNPPKESAKCPLCGRGGKIRSDRQNRYLWGIVYQILADETGHSTEEIHAFCRRFLPRVFVTVGSVEEEVEKSTTSLTTSEFEDYTLRVRVFAAQELQCQIPLPNETL